VFCVAVPTVYVIVFCVAVPTVYVIVFCVSVPTVYAIMFCVAVTTFCFSMLQNGLRMFQATTNSRLLVLLQDENKQNHQYMYMLYYLLLTGKLCTTPTQVQILIPNNLYKCKFTMIAYIYTYIFISIVSCRAKCSVWLIKVTRVTERCYWRWDYGYHSDGLWSHDTIVCVWGGGFVCVRVCAVVHARSAAMGRILWYCYIRRCTTVFN